LIIYFELRIFFSFIFEYCVCEINISAGRAPCRAREDIPAANTGKGFRPRLSRGIVPVCA
jgi:hypothetical protein